MQRRMQAIPIIMGGIMLGLQLYAWSGLWSIFPQLSSGWVTGINTVSYGLFGLSILSFIAILSLGGQMSKALRNFFFTFVFMHLTFVLVLDVFVLMDDIARFGAWLFAGREALHFVPVILTGFFVALVPAFLFLLGMFVGPYRYRIHETQIPLPRLPQGFDGLRIVQISDIHSGSFYNKSAVKKGIDMILKAKPDVIFFTGDLVNDEATEIEPYKGIFGELKAPLGVYSILGNHDYGDYTQWPSAESKQANFERLKEIHGEMGWRLLLDEHVYLNKNDETIAVIGVENWGKGFHQEGDLKKAYEGCEAPVKLLLSHDPTHWDEQVLKDYKDIDITFSGHTHGAQMGFEWGKWRWSPITLRYKKWAGLYKKASQYLYINRGFGFLGYPGRLGIWPEISVITLKANK